MSDDNMIQRVIITFSDGKVATFSGRVAVSDVDERSIKNIQFTLPEELPDGCSWDRLKDDQ